LGLLSPPLQAADWNVLRSKHGEVFFSPSRREVAREVAEVLDREYERVGRGVGYEGKALVRVFLAPSQEEFDRITRGRIPDWGKGCAFPAYGVVVLRPLEDNPAGLRQTLAHEVTHVLLHRATGGMPIPRWFDEGVAMWYALEWGKTHSFRLGIATLLGKLIPLEEIEGVLSFGSGRAELAYAESFSAVIFLLRRYGGDSVRRIAGLMREGTSFEEAMERATGVPYGTFLEEWRKHVRARYHPLVVLTEGPYFWIGITALFMFVYWVKRRRAKKIEQEWEEEEQDTPDEPFLSA